METLQRTANRGSISTGYDIDNSLKLEADDLQNLNKTFSSAGNRKIWTFSCWFKRTEIGGSIRDSLFASYVDTNNRLRFNYSNEAIQLFGKTSGTTINVTTNALYRDASAFYHVVWACDTTQSTAADRFKLYVNGEQVTSFSTATYPAQDSEPLINSNVAHYIGQRGDVQAYANGYIAETHFVDGQELSPTDFGEYDSDSGIWIPKEYTGTYGTNGFYLDFEDAANLGDDKSGNNNDFTETNITSADQATDTPTNNFCTLNPLMGDNNAPTISEGATKATGGGGYWNRAFGTQGVKNGKWYWEMKVTNTSYSGYIGATTTPAENSELQDAQIAYNTSAWAGNPARIDFYTWKEGSQQSYESTGWGTLSVNDVLGVAVDLDASTKTIAFYKNGTLLSGTTSNPFDMPAGMQDEFVFPVYFQYENRQDELNFGGYTTSTLSSAASDANGYGNFEYAPPSGYYALCTKNIAEYG